MKSARKPPRLHLLCVVCDGGVADVNGAYVVCALCLVDGREPAPAQAAEPAAA